MAQAFSLPALPQIVGVFFAVRRARGIFDANVGEENCIFARETMNDVGISKKNRKRDSFVEEHLRGANYFWILTFGKDNTLRIAHGAVDDPAHDSSRSTESRLELFAISLQIHE